MTSTPNNDTKTPFRLPLFPSLFLLLLLAIAFVGHMDYYHQRDAIRAVAAEQLHVIANLKADQLLGWRAERFGDARQIQNTPFFPHIIAQYFANPDPDTKTKLLAWMKSLRDNGGYSRVVLVDPQLNVRLAIPEDQGWIGERSHAKIKEVLSTGKIVESDLHRSEVSGYINMDLLIPIFDTNVIAAIGLEIKPEKFLFPLLQTWPTPSRSAETLLVRRDGNDVLYLNELRHYKNSALALHFPVANLDSPAGRAVRGEQGIINGIDYRGVPVLADIRHIEGSPWFMVSKIDQKEVLAPIWEWVKVITIFFLAIVFCFFLIWQRYQLKTTQEREEKILHAEEALVREQQLLNSLMQTIPDHIYFKDIKSCFVRINAAMSKAFGVATPEEVIGKTDFDIFSEEHARQAYEDEQRIMTTGEPILSKEEKETWPDGHVTWVSTTKVPLRNETGEIIGLVGVSRDVTKHRLLEEQFRQSQKMQAVGQLAGGVAHDFNNMLTAILGYSTVTLQHLPQQDPLRSNIEEISRAAERAAGLTRQLLAFSRRQTLQPRLLNLNDIVTDMKKMFIRFIGEQVELHTYLAPVLENVRADRTQIEQVIMNLVLNARDAMAGQTRPSHLTIETSNTNLDETYTSRFTDLAPGDYVLISVNDNGCGMPPEIKARIFEPFFTTKEMGKGLGLGLATCYGIVKQTGGHISVYSEVGIGTTFKVYLPCVNKTEPEPIIAAPISAPAVTITRGSETILLVEDEEIVRELFSVVLRERGYTVLEAANGAKALQLLHELDAAPDLLITDVVMPEMDGHQLSEQVRRLHPNMKIIFVSGYSEEIITKQGILDPGIILVQKPCNPTVLTRKVREILDR